MVKIYQWYSWVALYGICEYVMMIIMGGVKDGISYLWLIIIYIEIFLYFIEYKFSLIFSNKGKSLYIDNN